MAKRILGVERAEWWFWLKWVPASAVTVGAAGVALWPAIWAQAPAWVVFGALAVGGAVGSVVAGAVVGTAQWLILRRRVHRGGWWVLASAVGLAVGWMAGGRVGSVTGAVGVAWVGLVVGAVYGALTGIVLVLLLRRPIQPGRPAPDA